jgi:hypothetical protein
MLELIRRHKETDNDVYFLDVIGDRVVINDDYRGLKVLSTDLEPLMNIPVFDGWIIDRMYNSDRTDRKVQKIKDPKGPELDWHDLVFIQGMWIFVCEDQLCFVEGETRRQELHAESPHDFCG